MKDKRRSETIVLLNEGEKGGLENHCNSWPSEIKYEIQWSMYPEPCRFV